MENTIAYISLELLLLNDLFQRNYIDEEIYKKAHEKLIASAKDGSLNEKPTAPITA